ncbi:MAG: hypothetical protein HOW97_25280 [Catenulispora sp.]|nr:hypothetical protein [Catenulispora sp.]
MSEAGLPGMGLKLGAELLRSPNGVWYSATGADGGTLGVLRFEAALLKPSGAVDRLIERVVAARAGMLPGTLPVVDLVEDAGRIWLITAQVPVADSASRTEALLLGSAPVSVPGGGAAGLRGGPGTSGGSGGSGGPGVPGGRAGSGGRPGAQGNGVANGYAAQGSAMEAPWRPSVQLGTTGQFVQPVPTRESSPGGRQQWTKKELKDPVGRRMTRALVGLVLVAVVVGAATVAGLKLRDKKPTTQVKITGISVQNTNPVQPAGICNATVDMEAAFTTNGGTGTVRYEWEIPANNNKVQIVPGSQAISGTSPAVHLDWKLNLHGSGTVTAKFRVTNPEVLAGGTDPSSSGDLKYQCP